MKSKKVEQALNHQIKEEIESAYIYLAMSAEADRMGLSYDMRMRQITLMVFSALEGVGLTAAVAEALEKENIPANIVAATLHDHVFVPSERADDAMKALRALQREAQLS